MTALPKRLRHHRLVRVPLLIAVVLWVALSACQAQHAKPVAQGPDGEPAAARYYLAEAPEQAPGPCSACGAITLLRFDDRGHGPVDQAYLDELARQLRTLYGLDVTVAPPLPIPTAAFDATRKQWDGARLVDQLQTSIPSAKDGTTVVALMNEDLYLGWKPEWRWAFGGRRTFDRGGGWAVISAFRMTGPPAPRRMLVMLGKYVGGIACGFPEVEAPSSIMYGNVLSAADLDRMNAIACYRDSTHEN